MILILKAWFCGIVSIYILLTFLNSFFYVATWYNISWYVNRGSCYTASRLSTNFFSPFLLLVKRYLSNTRTLSGHFSFDSFSPILSVLSYIIVSHMLWSAVWFTAYGFSGLPSTTGYTNGCQRGVNICRRRDGSLKFQIHI